MNRGSAMHVQSNSMPEPNTRVETTTDKQPISGLYAGGFQTPYCAPEHRSRNRGCHETFDRARGALFAPGELGERRFRREAQRGFRAIRGVLSLGDFSLHEQREVAPAVREPQLGF